VPAAAHALALLSFPLLLAGCGTAKQSTAPLRYVALGDSYTIGTALDDATKRWPAQLVAALAGNRPALIMTRNLGTDGYTSADLIEVELPLLHSLDPEFVTVLIGVNDVVQGVPVATYRSHLVTIFDTLLERLPPSRILVVTTPDYTVTPRGADYGDPATESAAIAANNRILEQVAGARGLTVVDVFDLSRRADDDLSLVAGDGLHPSGSQYALWVGRIAPAVRTLLAHD
jgi:acyl-CoA thioesterase I